MIWRPCSSIASSSSANLEGGDITPVIDALEKIGEKYNVKFVLSVSMDAADLPENAKKDVVVAL